MDKFQLTFQSWAASMPRELTYLNKTHTHSKTKDTHKLPVHFDGECPCIGEAGSHYEKRQVIRIIAGKEIESEEYRPKPDSKVCERERLWREYCTVRDGKNYHVEG